MGRQALDAAFQTAPSARMSPSTEVPPKTTISEPVQKAWASNRGDSGAPGTFRQVRAAGSKAAPSGRGSASGSPVPPQITISRPVQTVAWPIRPPMGALGSRRQPGPSAAEAGVVAAPAPAGPVVVVVALPPDGAVPCAPGPLVVDVWPPPSAAGLPPVGAPAVAAPGRAPPEAADPAPFGSPPFGSASDDPVGASVPSSVVPGAPPPPSAVVPVVSSPRSCRTRPEAPSSEPTVTYTPAAARETTAIRAATRARPGCAQIHCRARLAMRPPNRCSDPRGARTRPLVRFGGLRGAEPSEGRP